jgi:hypothetical protein
LPTLRNRFCSRRKGHGSRNHNFDQASKGWFAIRSIFSV